MDVIKTENELMTQHGAEETEKSKITMCGSLLLKKQRQHHAKKQNKTRNPGVHHLTSTDEVTKQFHTLSI